MSSNLNVSNSRKSPAPTLRDTLEVESKVHIVSEEQADSNGSWPPEPYFVRNEVTGLLADRIRGKLGVKRRKVFIVEETYYGGYSEYTQENSTTFEVQCGDQSKEFFPPNSEDSWAGLHGNDSVFARFQFWLRTAEDPIALWNEGVIPAKKQVATLSLDTLQVVPGSLLFGVLSNYFRGPELKIYLCRLSNGRYGLDISRTYRGESNPSHEFVSLHIKSGPEGAQLVRDEDRAVIIRVIADHYSAGRQYC